MAGAEVGAVFCGATLLTGSIWGRASWGVWWTWDARLTLTAILFALSLGYLALRRAIENPHSRALVSAMVALLMALTVFIISASYSQTIDEFPTGGGGYLVATKLLGEAAKGDVDQTPRGPLGILGKKFL